jgi:hypothetical protein
MNRPEMPFGLPSLDPSKMDPRLLMQLSQLVQQLPQDKLRQMQTLMHNAMAGLDVRNEMQEFEKSLPADFRTKIFDLMGAPPAAAATRSSVDFIEEPSFSGEMDLLEARLTILKAVSNGQMTPYEAEKLLFPK